MTHINDNLIRHELALLHEILGRLPIVRASSDLRPQQISSGDVHQTELQIIRKLLTELLPSSGTRCTDYRRYVGHDTITHKAVHERMAYFGLDELTLRALARCRSP